MRTYVAEAGLSPTRTAASPGVTPRSRRARISVCSSARSRLPTAVPSINLAGKTHRARLANHHDLDLTRVLQLALDPAGNLIRQLAGLAVIDRGRGHDHAHLSARLNGIHLLHAGELARELLQLGEAFHVGFECLAAGAGPRPRDGVGRLHDHAHRRLVLDVVVVRRDAVDDDRVLAELGRHLDAKLDVRAVVLVREHLADVVQQGAALGELDVELQLGRHNAGEPGDFLRVLQDVLPVRRAVAHPPHQLYELRVHALDARLVHRLLARLDDPGLDLGPAFPDDLLDPPGVDAPVGDEALEREPTHLPSHRVEARDHDRVRRVVDDHVHPGGGLEGADVAAFPPDDASLHLVGGEGHGGHGALGGVLGRDPLDRDGEDLLRLAVGALLRLLFQLPGERGGFAPGLVLEPPQQLLFRLLRGEAGDLLEAGPRLGLLGPECALPLLAGLLPAPQLAGLGFEARHFLLDLVLAPLDVAPPTPYLSIPRVAGAHQLFFRRQHHPLARVFQEACAVRCGGLRGGIRHPPLHAPPHDIESRSRGDPAAKEGCDDCQPVQHRIYLRQRFAWEAERVEPQTAPSAVSRQLSADG